MSSNRDWIVCQLGARENYAVARALHGGGALTRLVTDAWADGWSGLIPGRLAQRRHPDIPRELVRAATGGLIVFEAKARARRDGGWSLIMRRNSWFQRRAVAMLKRESPAEERALFAYSYAARRILKDARKQGWQTTLGQIDPGPAEERIVEELHRRYPEANSNWTPAPKEYWEKWREECAAADTIIVNSEWAREALEKEGVDREKLRVVPLVYTPPITVSGFRRVYPERFTNDRPMRVLFLGQLTLRKGIMETLEAAQALEGEPVEFLLVGPERIRRVDLPNVRWIGPVSRREVEKWYRQADVFLFPTHSDGFGLTQLEARAWKLPVVASRHCGRVVRDGENGILLDAVGREQIADALCRLMADGERLLKLAECEEPGMLGLKGLREQLMSL